MIRPATIEDVPAIVKLLQECGLYNPDLKYDQWSHPTLVADYDGHVVGMTQAIIGYPYAMMTEMAVRAGHRDQRVASALIEALEGILKAAGVQAWGAVIPEVNLNSWGRMEHLGGHLHLAGRIYFKRIA